MNIRSGTPSKRAYRSTVRAEHAAHTRQRILDAAIRLFGRDPDELTMADLAREAAVAIPTVYRHFRTLDEVLEAVTEHANRRLLAGVPPMQDRATLAPALRTLFANLAALGPEIVGLMHTGRGRQMRRARLPERRAHVAGLFAAELAALPPKERAYLADWLAVLLSTAMARIFDDYLGLDADGAAARVVWLVDLLGRDALGRRARGKRR